MEWMNGLEWNGMRERQTETNERRRRKNTTQTRRENNVLFGE